MNQISLKNSMFYEVFFPKAREDLQKPKDLTLTRSIRFKLDPKTIVSKLPIVVFDFETTGLNPKSDHIIEIGAQRIENGIVTKEMSTLIHTPLALSEAIVKITGISKDMLIGKPHIKDVLDDFLDFIKGSILVAHNASFDKDFLFHACSRFNIEIEWPIFCTLKMARDLLPDLERKNLDTLAEHYGLSFEARHRSIGDVKVTSQVLKFMLEQEGEHLCYWKDFSSYTVT